VARRRKAWRIRYLTRVSTLVSEASAGNTHPLYEFLKSGPSLSKNDGKHLVWLLEGLQQRTDELRPRKRGRPTGPTGTFQAAQQCAVYLLHVGKTLYRRKEKRSRVPKEVTRRLIEHAVMIAKKRFRNFAIAIDPDRSLPKLSADAIQDAKELFPNAKLKMKPALK